MCRIRKMKVETNMPVGLEIFKLENVYMNFECFWF